jgi:hypothetical protein
MKNSSKTLAAVAAGVLTIGGIGAGAVASHAATPRTPHTVASVTRADTDHVQQGDQTTPDVPGAPTDEAATTSTVAKKVAQHTAPTHSDRGHSARGHESRTSDSPESSSENSSENEDASESQTGPGDGPGGHQDPPGDVQHVGGQNEH